MKEKLTIFPDKQNLREFVTSRHVQQEILREILQAKMKGHRIVTLIHMKK